MRKSNLQTRNLVLIGFGGLLLLLISLGLNALHVLRMLQTQNETVRNDYIFRDRILEQLRSEIYLSGTYVRDLLLERDPRRADFHRRELERAHRQIDELTRKYDHILQTGEQEKFKRFREQLATFFESVAPALMWNAAERERLGYAFMQNSLLPGRMAIVSLTDQLGEVNEHQLTENSKKVGQTFENFRRRLLFLLTLTLAVGSSLAAISFYWVLRLERETSQRFVEAMEARHSLRELSARLVEVQETERKALSRELHDEVGQSLSALLLGIGNLAAMLEPLPDSRTDREIRKLRRLTERTVSTVRDMSLLLRPSMLDDLGLVPALEWQAREVSRTTNVRVKVSAEDVGDGILDEQKTCIYRVVQEALHNIVRHSRATEATVTLGVTQNRLLLEVADNGIGFEPAHEKGVGLLGMEERVKHLSGNFQVVARAGEGASISVELPLALTPSRAPVT